MKAAAIAGIVYFAIVFAVGFALGSLRVLVVAPALGAVLAVALELPIILALSWIACRWCVRHHAVPAAYSYRLAMGGVAFLLLIGAEMLLAVSLFGQSVPQFLTAYGTAEGALGLIGQVAFAAFPLLQIRSG